MSENQALTVQQPKMPSAETLEALLIKGNLARLTPAQRVEYYMNVCQSLGLNPMTKPFDYIELNGKLVLYAKKDATDQLRRIYHVSVVDTKTEQFNDVLMVTVTVQTPDRRVDYDVGAVTVKGMTGENLANAYMKANTKAKRRATLSIVGLGFMDESETSGVPGGRLVQVDLATGEIATNAPKQIPAPKEIEDSASTDDPQRQLYLDRIKPMLDHPSVSEVYDHEKQSLDDMNSSELYQLGRDLKAAQDRYKEREAAQDAGVPYEEYESTVSDTPAGEADMLPAAAAEPSEAVIVPDQPGDEANDG